MIDLKDLFTYNAELIFRKFRVEIERFIISHSYSKIF